MSDTYRALTRKYRPNSFEDIVSQDHVSSTLMNAIKQNRLSHAYMFCGPRGVGKTTMARVLARVINNIDADVDGEALNQTMSITEMDAASNNKVEDVHHLREIVRIPPQNSLYKVIIVDEVHMLSKAAFNALLKTLEEPPEHIIFIFATTEPHKVLPTILSRVQRFDFKRISVEEIVHRLRKISLDENISIDEESLHVIAKKADGALRDALGLMDQAIAFCGDTITHNELLQALNVVGTDRLFEFMSCVKAHDADQGLELINTLLQEGYDIQEFLIGLTEHLRNLYIAHHSEKMYLVEASEETKAKYKTTSSDFSRDDLMRMLHIVSEAQIKLKDAHQPRIQFEITLLKLIHMERSENLSKLLGELEDLKKNFRNLGGEEATEAQRDKDTDQNSNREQHDEGKELQSGEEDTEKNSVKQEPVRADGHPPQHEITNEEPQIENGFEVAPEDAESSESKEFLAPEPVEEVVPEPAPVHDEYDLGQPALVTEVTQKAKVLHFPNGNGNHAPKKTIAPIETAEEVPAKKILVEDVRAVWSEFISSLENNVPKVLELQIQRVQPSRLKGTELTLECDNAFAQQMLDEQAHDLSLRLKEHIGVMLRFRTEVKRQEGNASKAKNPYERFKEIQQKDPIIRDLVERFGAELEY
ncbi:MAG: DNA polymerase III subunit gamma/tau [Balneola sp.]